jgi:hypothetical protein
MLTQFSLSATTQPLATFAMTFGNSPQTPWDKRRRASWLLMKRNLVFKKVSLVFDSLTTRAHSIFSSWTTAYTIQPLWWIIFQWNILQRNSLMQMAIQTRRLASNLDNQLMFYLVFWAVQEDFSHSSIWFSRSPFWWRILNVHIFLHASLIFMRKCNYRLDT